MKKETGFLIRNIAVRRVLIWATQAVIFAASTLAAFLLRFDFSVPAFYLRYLPYALAIWLPVKFVVFYAAKLDRGFWRYLSAIDLVRISIANVIASIIGFFSNSLAGASGLSSVALRSRFDGLFLRNVRSPALGTSNIEAQLTEPG